MAILNVNPTRMELKKLKTRLKTAVRGHKLLKDKSDELIRRFTLIVRETKKLRSECFEILSLALKQFSRAGVLMEKSALENAFAMPSVKLEVEAKTESIMNVVVPKLELAESHSGALPYAFSAVTSEADYSVVKITEALAQLVKLAELQKKSEMLSLEIVRNKRRVNALEYVMIPQLEETIKYIKDKLEENERGALTRLMKVKAMLEENS